MTKDWYKTYERINNRLSGVVRTKDHEIHHLYQQAEFHVQNYEDLLDEGGVQEARYELEKADSILSTLDGVKEIDKFAVLESEELEE